MSDARRRAVEREAAHDPAARAALLTERMRAGELTLERLELAAYCGSEDARVALMWPDGATAWCTSSGSPADYAPARQKADAHWDGKAWIKFTLVAWARGLSRWGPDALVRASVAAARCVFGFDDDHDGCEGAHLWGDCEAAGRVIDAAEADLGIREPLDPRWHTQKVWSDAWGALSGRADGARRWLPTPYGALPHTNVYSVEQCASLEDEPTVRSAIQESLSRWALGGT